MKLTASLGFRAEPAHARERRWPAEFETNINSGRPLMPVVYTSMNEDVTKLQYNAKYGYIKLIRDLPRWSTLNRLGKSRLLRTSFVWLLLVPIFARLLANVGTHHTLEVFGSEFTLTLALPFSWKLFFYSSVCVAIASGLYSLFCPEIVRDYDSYADFSAKGFAGRQIIAHFQRVIPRWSRHRKHVFQEFIDTFTNDSGGHARSSVFVTMGVSTDRETAEMRSKLAAVTVDSASEADAFWFTRDLGDIRAPYPRWACLVLYVAGFAMLSVVFVQNCMYVVCFT